MRQLSSSRLLIPLLATGVFLVILLWTTLAIIEKDGRFTYPLDDAYIHLQIARNLVTTGTWGINPGLFSSAGSSLLWPLLLALLYLTNLGEFGPLILNTLLAIGFIFLLNKILSDYQTAPFLRFCALGLTIAATPLVALTISGMEHILLINLVLIFIYLVAQIAEKSLARMNKLDIFWLLLTTSLLAMTRYETIPIIFAVSIFIVYSTKKSWLSGLVLLAAIAPLLIFGTISVLNQNPFIPNTILLKGVFGAFIKRNPFWHPFELGSLLALLGCLVYGAIRKQLSRELSLWLLVTTVAVLFQIFFVRTSMFFRHDAHLVPLLIITFFLVISREDKSLRRYPIILGAIFVLVGSPLLERAIHAQSIIVQATSNIFSQQYQMAQFVKTYYSSSTVVLNDIGAVAYFNDVRVVDLVGLGSPEIARARLNQHYNKQFAETIGREEKASIAIIYESWFPESIPENWTKIGKWKIPNNVVAGSDTVSFYALNKDLVQKFRNNLTAYTTKLPRSVAATIF